MALGFCARSTLESMGHLSHGKVDGGLSIRVVDVIAHGQVGQDASATLLREACAREGVRAHYMVEPTGLATGVLSGRVAHLPPQQIR